MEFRARYAPRVEFFRRSVVRPTIVGDSSILTRRSVSPRNTSMHQSIRVRRVYKESSRTTRELLLDTIRCGSRRGCTTDTWPVDGGMLHAGVVRDGGSIWSMVATIIVLTTNWGRGKLSCIRVCIAYGCRVLRHGGVS